MNIDTTLLDACLLAYDSPNISDYNGAEAYVEYTEGSVIIAITGTDSVVDAIMDIWAVPWKPKRLGEWVHRGVWKQTSALAEQLVPTLNKQSKIYITGHSLGGGIAQQLAGLLLKDGYRVTRLTTFGSMKSGFKGLNTLTKNIPGVRYVRDGDTVPELPPSIFQYSHDRPEVTLCGDPSIFGDHGLMGYQKALWFYLKHPR